ncbi:hypothetical protein CsatB_023410 [Cannabis sativa]|uniref:uncharacterized protein LOC115713028 n=1 Tax=Cannabis sativa TaxID=3483 RepID=UPI0029CA9537|nr:uncharacterized protein LOC115713028 [Cannabis sativa]
MPVRDPRAGRAFICVISWFLFLTIAGGGGCLIMYMILPETNTTSWLPVVGITLVCLPWLFWLSTFMYRILSRIFGFRIGIGEDNDNHNNISNNDNNTNNVIPEEEEEAGVAAASSDHSEQKTEYSPAERRLQFEATLTVHDDDENENYKDDGDGIIILDHKQRSIKQAIVSKSSSSSSNSSVLSHESELPLASSRAP